MATYDEEHLNAWLDAGKPRKKGHPQWKKFFDVKPKGDGSFWKDGREIITRQEVGDTLRDLYFNPSTGFTGTDRLYSQAKRHYKGILRRDVANFLKRVPIHQQTHAQHKKTTIKPIVPKSPGHIQIDLVDMSATANHNNGFSWIMTVLDLFSKRAWAERMTRKDDEHAQRALVDVLNQMRSENFTPRIIQTDNGSEFKGGFEAELKDRKIRHVFSKSHSPQTQGAVERFNRTFKTMLERYLLANNTKRWIDSGSLTR